MRRSLFLLATLACLMAGGDLKTFATHLDAEPAQRQADFQLIVDRLHGDGANGLAGCRHGT